MILSPLSTTNLARHSANNSPVEATPTSGGSTLASPSSKQQRASSTIRQFSLIRSLSCQLEPSQVTPRNVEQSRQNSAHTLPSRRPSSPAVMETTPIRPVSTKPAELADEQQPPLTPALLPRTLYTPSSSDWSTPDTYHEALSTAAEGSMRYGAAANGSDGSVLGCSPEMSKLSFEEPMATEWLPPSLIDDTLEWIASEYHPSSSHNEEEEDIISSEECMMEAPSLSSAGSAGSSSNLSRNSSLAGCSPGLLKRRRKSQEELEVTTATLNAMPTPRSPVMDASAKSALASASMSKKRSKRTADEAALAVVESIQAGGHRHQPPLVAYAFFGQESTSTFAAHASESNRVRKAGDENKNDNDESFDQRDHLSRRREYRPVVNDQEAGQEQVELLVDDDYVVAEEGEEEEGEGDNNSSFRNRIQRRSQYIYGEQNQQRTDGHLGRCSFDSSNSQLPIFPRQTPMGRIDASASAAAAASAEPSSSSSLSSLSMNNTNDVTTLFSNSSPFSSIMGHSASSSPLVPYMLLAQQHAASMMTTTTTNNHNTTTTTRSHRGYSMPSSSGGSYASPSTAAGASSTAAAAAAAAPPPNQAIAPLLEPSGLTLPDNWYQQDQSQAEQDQQLADEIHLLHSDATSARANLNLSDGFKADDTLSHTSAPLLASSSSLSLSPSLSPSLSSTNDPSMNDLVTSLQHHFASSISTAASSSTTPAAAAAAASYTMSSGNQNIPIGLQDVYSSLARRATMPTNNASRASTNSAYDQSQQQQQYPSQQQQSFQALYQHSQSQAHTPSQSQRPSNTYAMQISSSAPNWLFGGQSGDTSTPFPTFEQQQQQQQMQGAQSASSSPYLSTNAAMLPPTTSAAANRERSQTSSAALVTPSSTTNWIGGDQSQSQSQAHTLQANVSSLDAQSVAMAEWMSQQQQQSSNNNNNNNNNQENWVNQGLNPSATTSTQQSSPANSFTLTNSNQQQQQHLPLDSSSSSSLQHSRSFSLSESEQQFQTGATAPDVIGTKLPSAPYHDTEEIVLRALHPGRRPSSGRSSIDHHHHHQHSHHHHSFSHSLSSSSSLSLSEGDVYYPYVHFDYHPDGSVRNRRGNLPETSPPESDFAVPTSSLSTSGIRLDGHRRSSNATTGAAAAANANANANANNMVPKTQEEKMRSSNDLYTPRWVRGDGTAREAWCSLCDPGKWMQLKTSQYWYHVRGTHGVNSVTGKIYDPPLQLRCYEDAAGTTLGLCGECNKWVAICTAKRKRTFAAWFKHAHKCHKSDRARSDSIHHHHHPHSDSNADYDNDAGNGGGGDGGGAATTSAEQSATSQHFNNLANFQSAFTGSVGNEYKDDGASTPSTLASNHGSNKTNHSTMADYFQNNIALSQAAADMAAAGNNNSSNATASGTAALSPYSSSMPIKLEGGWATETDASAVAPPHRQYHHRRRKSLANYVTSHQAALLVKKESSSSSEQQQQQHVVDQAGEEEWQEQLQLDESGVAPPPQLPFDRRGSLLYEDDGTSAGFSSPSASSASSTMAGLPRSSAAMLHARRQSSSSSSSSASASKRIRYIY